MCRAFLLESQPTLLCKASGLNPQDQHSPTQSTMAVGRLQSPRLQRITLTCGRKAITDHNFPEVALRAQLASKAHTRQGASRLSPNEGHLQTVISAINLWPPQLSLTSKLTNACLTFKRLPSRNPVRWFTVGWRPLCSQQSYAQALPGLFGGASFEEFGNPLNLCTHWHRPRSW